MRETPEEGPSLPCCCRWRSRGRGRGIGDGGNFLKEGTPLSPPSVSSRSEYFWLCYSLWLFHLHSAVKRQPFSPVFPLAGATAKAFSGYPCGTSRKKASTMFYNTAIFLIRTESPFRGFGLRKDSFCRKEDNIFRQPKVEMYRCPALRQSARIRDKPAPRAVAADLSRWPFYDNEQITVGPFPHGGTG